ncbi:SusC/RagA family TonB-linked outer membrane protein [Aquimarina agarilytica]|uniref:SusC/RagA family TonB-linked outer membrane protein n=1 Tax=Aquimarina agarilytica TaxID=1087449 RepID=UPI0002FE9460|nr:TonB-dependent receptor [Aquimarina agarilytica]
MKNNFRLVSLLKTILFTSIMLLSFGFVSAQTKTISGTVTAEGIPLPGVSVTIKGKSVGAVTDFDGLYAIEAEESDVLQFLYVGYVTQEVKVTDNTTVDVSLVEDVNNLSEIVVVGYGTLEKKELTGSQVSLKSEDINKVQAVSFEEALQGKAAGVQITTSQGGPGDAATIQIRGATSINASSAPLYVVDGVEIDGDPIGVGGSDETGAAQSSPLSTIDPNNIESIEILKDASATSIYGSRGANGVVIIQTKTGKSNTGLTFDFNASTGVQTISKHIDLLGAQEYVDYFREAFPFDPTNRDTRFQQTAFRDNNGRDLALDAVGPDGLRRFNVRDFRDEIFREAIVNKYSISARQGSSDFWFSGSLSYTDQEGIVKNTDYKRIQSNVNVGGNVNSRLQVGFQVNGGRADRSGIVSATPDASGTGGAFGVITNLALATPVQGRFDTGRQGEGASGVQRDETGFVTRANGRFIINPVLQVNKTINEGEELFGFISTYLEYKLVEGLKFKSSLSFNTYNNDGRVFFPGSFGLGQFIGGGLAVLNKFSQARYQNNNTLTYDKLLGGKHKIAAVLGSSIIRSETRIQTTRSTNFASDSVNLDALAAGVNFEATSDRQENGLLGIFARFNYSFDKRYVISAAARGDKSSRFFPGSTQWGFFPSVGLTWNASEESFFDNVGFLSNLRFKASVGQTGNDKIGVFQSRTSYNIDRDLFFRGNPNSINAASVRNGSRANGFFLGRVSNPDLTWETTTQYDLGGEIGLFNNRLNIGVDWFLKNTTDLLLEKPTASQAGFPFVLENAGEVENTGYEFSLSSVNVDTGDFRWSTNFNISFIQNEVVSLGGVRDEFLVSSSAFRTVSNDFIVREGSPLNSIYGFVSDGVYQYSDFEEFEDLTPEQSANLYRTNTKDGTGNLLVFGGDFTIDGVNYTLKDGVASAGAKNRPGQQKLKDLNEDGRIDESDLTIIGDANPDHFGGITNNFKYKSWDLSVALNWKYGNDIYNKNLLPGFNTNQFANKYGVARERWTPSNTETRVHSLRGRLRQEGFATVSDYIEDGSFLRLQNISLGYNLPLEAVKNIGLSSLRIYGAADNLHVWSDYSGYDPDVSVSRGTNSGLTQGVDFDAYPKARTFRIGIKGTF